jgi:hypothetical protein
MAADSGLAETKNKKAAKAGGFHITLSSMRRSKGRPRWKFFKKVKTMGDTSIVFGCS